MTKLNFLRDLRKLLKKYRATIYADIDVNDNLVIDITFAGNVWCEINYQNEYLNEELVGYLIEHEEEKEKQCH